MLGMHDIGLLNAIGSQVAAAAFVIALGIGYVYRLGSSRLVPTRLRRRPRHAWFTGNLEEMFDPEMEDLEGWLDTYGMAFESHGLFGSKVLYIADHAACTHVLNHSMKYSKPKILRQAAMSLIGPGVFTVEGEAHKIQRKIVNPAFSAAQIKELVPTMLQKIHELKEIWRNDIANSGPDIEVQDGLNRATLDIIGEAGFGYQLNALSNSDDELSKAFHDLFGATEWLDPIRMLGNMYPIISFIPLARNKAAWNSHTVMDRIGDKLIADKREELKDSMGQGALLGKDILTVLIKTVMQGGIGSKLTDEEIRAQVPTMITAGHETSATMASWALYALSKHPKIQDKLRQELSKIQKDSPSLEELNELTYLDYFIKETFRYFAPVKSLQREPLEDDIIPLSQPILDKNGNECRELHVKAGTSIFLSIAGLNWSKQFWGVDAHQFRPERFENLPDTVNAIPSMWGNLLTFGAGPRGCIGWRFAVAEMKAILFVMVRSFKYEIDPTIKVYPKLVIVSRPYVGGKMKLPLIVTSL